MRVTYSLEIVARCPNDRLPDHYEVRIEAFRTVWVEDILAFVATFSADAETHLSQEDITVAIARQFAAKVTTIGHHSGVRTEVVA